MSSGSAITTGPGRPATARWKAWLTSSGMRAGSSICATHFESGPNMRRVIPLLEGLALDLVARHLADEENHRRRILEGGVDADRGVGGAGPAGDEADAGPAGQLAIGLGHVGGATFL